MDYTSLFYWLVVADNARAVFITFSILFGIISVISVLGYLASADDGHDENQRMARKWMWWAIPFLAFFLLLMVFTPSKKDSLLIVAGGGALNYLTTDKSAKQIPAELSHFVLTEIKNMAKDSDIDLNIKDEKQRVLDEAKKMSPSELIEKMKVDSTLRKIILE